MKLNKSMEKTKNQRFLEKKMDENDKYLGPGCYDMPREFDRAQLDYKGSAAVSKVISDWFKGKQEQRFKHDVNPIPGPGHYGGEDTNPWNKKTYNLLLNNEQ